jgi:transposase
MIRLTDERWERIRDHFPEENIAIAPHRGNRSKPPTQDRRRLSRYMRRWLVERFFAWIQWQRWILIRWEYHAHNFLGFLQLACLIILFKRF